jgi:2,3-bisphosphoglycerate-dependent phosphoglycerate mutase
MEYGTWSGKPLKQLSKDPIWKSIQSRPSLVRFPGGESFSEMSLRANQAVLEVAAGKNRIAIVSHGDVIKAIIAFHLGMSLDSFQRLSIDPASISILRVPSSQIILMNSTSHLMKTESPLNLHRDRYTLGGGQGRL